MKRLTIISCMALFTMGAMILFSPWMSVADVSEETSIDTLWSPREIEEFRMEFIRNFQRSGLNTTPGDANFLRIMIQSAGLKRGVEVGSASGFGAIHMGIAFEQTGGHLYTIDISESMVRQCRENIAKVGLEDSVTVILGDALEVLPNLEGKFDFVFLDAVKSDYFAYFKAIQPKLVPGAVIVADNVIISKDQMRDFLEAMENDPDYLMQIIMCSEEKGDGMAVILKTR